MKKAILIIILLLEMKILFSQTDTLMKGAFLTFFDFKKNTPTSQDSFKITLRQLNYDFDLYKIKTVNNTIKKNILKKYIWGIYDGHNLYINCYKITLKRGYSIAEEIGRYIYFKAPPYMNSAQERKIANSTFLYGAAGGVISAGQVYGEIADKYNYIIDTEIGLPKLLDRLNMIAILERYPDLLEQFMKETNQDDLTTLLKYIRILNSRKN